MIDSKAVDIYVSIQDKDFDVNSEIERLTSKNKNIGAVVSFLGLCRDEAGTLKALELEHYPNMADKQIERMANNAAQHWELDAVTVIHRYGLIGVGENIVLVITTSKHRTAAFQAANFIMDYLKTDAPFWKKEHKKDGSTGSWVEAKQDDRLKRDHWQNG
ncbi:molybdenum cofactor biosynthesis protein MoaE [Bartonella sp. HY038]|uniref:molybdenum cofactor biosynthesis protein MoaE n=1 Tax=Bartonella sp. HY038 TaxID=2759660 RepID=UPI0015FB7BDB|nr:molybdenum cofactor biosynthesis protein MoaE [Bartonella sp. HY038]